MPKIAETVILVVVLLTAVIGLYYMYTVSTGKAFLAPPQNIIVKTPIKGICCCETAKGHLFEPWGKMYKGEDPVPACDRICGKEHSTLAHPSTSIGPGKCGAYTDYG